MSSESSSQYKADSMQPIAQNSQLSTLSSSRVPWNPFWAILYAVFFFFASQLIAGVLVSLYPALQHWSSARANNWLNNDVTAQFAFTLLAEAIIVYSVYLWLKHHKTGFRLLGLSRPKGEDAAYGIIAWLVYLGVFIGVTAVITQFFPHFNVNQQQQIGFTNVYGNFDLLLTFISLVILPPIAEEIVMRGFIYGSLRKWLKPLWALVITSAIFAAAHLPEGGAGGPLWIGALDTFILSIFLCLLREKTGRLYASITLHMLKNGVAFVALFILKLH